MRDIKNIVIVSLDMKIAINIIGYYNANQTTLDVRCGSGYLCVDAIWYTVDKVY